MLTDALGTPVQYTINKRIHEEFRQRAKRNESFKMALSSPKVHRRGSMKESLRQSFEDLQDGFVSLSGRTSRSGSIRSRSSSVVSLHHPEDHHHQAYQRRSSTESSDECSGGRLNREKKNDVLSRSAAGLDKLSRGLGPRRPSRERINKRTRNSSRSRSVSREHLDDDEKQMGRRVRGNSRSRDNITDPDKKQSFGRDFVNFYMGKLK